MLLKVRDLKDRPNIIEDIEKASMRFITQALIDYAESAKEIFAIESDLVADIGEDITREALDGIGMSKMNIRLHGKIDYKKARYIFHPQYAVRQALFVDSKAEKVEGRGTITLQTAQTSMEIIQYRGRPPKHIREQGKLPKILEASGKHFLTTTIFVKYNYDEKKRTQKELIDITIAALPNGLLQHKYNPSADDTIWKAGRNAPSRGEAFRVRLDYESLSEKKKWRVQTIPVPPNKFVWRNHDKN